MGELGNLRHSAQKTIAQCVTIRTQKLANIPAKTPAHARSMHIERAKLPRRIIDVPLRNLAIAFVNPALLHRDALTSREVSR